MSQIFTLKSPQVQVFFVGYTKECVDMFISLDVFEPSLVS